MYFAKKWKIIFYNKIIMAKIELGVKTGNFVSRIKHIIVNYFYNFEK